MNKPTIVINIYGGPGAGKSTAAAELYAKMKRAGHSVELVREAAKSYVYSGNKISHLDQLDLFYKQLKLEAEPFGQVDYIITDSPLALGMIYQKVNHGRSYLMDSTDLIEAYIIDPNRINILLERTVPYTREGRFEMESDAKKLDNTVKQFLELFKVKYVTMKLDDDIMTEVMSQITQIKEMWKA